MQGTITDGGSRTTGSDVTAIAEGLAGRIGRQKYKIWFQDCTRLSLADGRLTICTASPFLAGWLQGHFLKDIEAAAGRVAGSVPQVSFAVDPELSEKQQPAHTDRASTATPAPGSPAGCQRSHVQRRSSRVRLTLNSFVVGPSNELAYNAARAVVRERHSPYNPLFIHGGCGVGKTHLLQGICNGLIEASPGARWTYMSAEEFANQFVLALKTKRLEVFRSRMRQTDLLAIDDIHFLASKPSTQEEFLHTFNTINLAGKQVVLASDAHPKMIGQLSDKLVSRFVSGMVVKIEPPDFETRCEICRRFVASLGSRRGPLDGPGRQGADPMPDEVIRYVADHVRTNVRELEGALVKLTACATLQRGPLTLATAEAALAEHLERCEPVVRAGDIESAVGAYFHVTPAQLHSPKRSHTISLARHFSMYLTRKHTHLSSSEIGRSIGNRNHATVLLACRKIEDLLAGNMPVNWQSPRGNKLAKARTILADIEDRICH